MTFRKILIRLANLLIAMFYMLGSLVVLFPNQPTVIPHEVGYTAVGILLLSTGIFGRGYYVEREK